MVYQLTCGCARTNSCAGGATWKKFNAEYFRNEQKYLEAQRIEMRTNYDIEMMLEIGYCSGIENYSRHLTGRAAGERPSTLIDFIPDGASADAFLAKAPDSIIKLFLYSDTVDPQGYTSISISPSLS